MESASTQSDVSKRITRTVITRSYETSNGQPAAEGASGLDVTLGGFVISLSSLEH